MDHYWLAWAGSDRPVADKAARREQWADGHPALPDLAERVQQLADEIERLRILLRQHAIDPKDKPA